MLIDYEPQPQQTTWSPFGGLPLAGNPFRLPNHPVQQWIEAPPQPPTPADSGLTGTDWKPFLWTMAGLAGLILLSEAFRGPCERRCGICGKTVHDARRCPQNAAKRTRLRIVKTGQCSCCGGRFRRTAAHHYAGPADGTRGREMCLRCHLLCGHGGDFQNMAVNPRYCRRRNDRNALFN
jgi:hypothetical protein